MINKIINDKEALIEKIILIAKALRLYHRHDTVGLETFPKSGKVILAVTHSLATYDIVLLFHAIYTKLNRIPRPLVDRLFFKIPYVAELTEAAGAIEGTPGVAAELLDLDEIITVAPGGMRESLRPSSQRYQILWDKRKGFAKLAIENQAPVVLAVCPKADDMYQVYQNKITKWAYQKFKIPVFFARGVGYTPIPRPIKLTHFLSKPISPPKEAKDSAAKKRQIDRFHKKLIKEANELIAKAIRHN